MVDGYTYSQMRNTVNYYCSKKNSGCKARVKVSTDGRLLCNTVANHIHPPPNYTLTASDTIFYEFVTSRRGKDLIMIDGYTFSQNTSRIWICSKYPKCKAKVSREPDGTISLMSKIHNHEPDRIVRTRDGKVIRV